MPVELRPIPDGEHGNIEFRAGSGGFAFGGKLIILFFASN